MNILFVNACARPESRTLQLAKTFLDTYLEKHPEDQLEELKLFEQIDLQYYDNAKVLQRDELLKKGELNHPMFAYAQQFAQADKILLAAPYWDLAFPAIVKVYFENICACGIAFAYTETGQVGLCKASKLFYVTTAGGPIAGNDLGAKFMEAACEMLGIDEFGYHFAENLDVIELDTTQILNDAVKKATQLAQEW